MTRPSPNLLVAAGRRSVGFLGAILVLTASGRCEKVVYRDACALTVAATPTTITLERGQTALVNVAANGTGTCKSQQRFWESSNPAVASVSIDGRITAVGAGSATVTVTVRDETYGTTGAASVTVSVSTPVSVAISSSAPTIDLGASRQLTAIVSGATSQAVQWTSSATNVVTVTPTGVATARDVGVAILTARSTAAPTKTAATTLTVAVSVTVSPSAIALNVGERQRVTAIVLGAVNTQVTWRSSNPSVLSVDASGLVTAVGPGTANVIATSVAAASRTGVAAVTVTGTAAPTLVHRWTFAQSGGAGTTLLDDVGGAHATIVNVGANDAVSQGGVVTLTGGVRDAADYVAMPPGLVSGRNSVTIEVWARHLSVTAWGRVFDIGSSPSNYLIMAWTQSQDPNADRVEWVHDPSGNRHRVDNSVAPYVLNTRYQIVMTIEAGGGAGGATLVKWYRDGQLKGSFETPLTLAQLQDTNLWLGRSLFDVDETANAAYDEVRIYQGALTATEVAARFTAGPVPNP